MEKGKVVNEYNLESTRYYNSSRSLIGLYMEWKCNETLVISLL